MSLCGRRAVSSFDDPDLSRQLAQHAYYRRLDPSGTSKFLFAPLAEAVIFAMLASYILSRTLVPTLAMYWLGGDHAKHNENRNTELTGKRRQVGVLGFFGAFNREFNRRFEQFRQAYRDLLAMCLSNTFATVVLFIGFVGATTFLIP
jgi:multidrug efflux pump subunit AcrB